MSARTQHHCNRMDYIPGPKVPNEKKVVSNVYIYVVSKPLTMVEGLVLLTLFGQGSFFTVPDPKHPSKHIFHVVDNPYSSSRFRLNVTNHSVARHTFDGCRSMIHTLSWSPSRSSNWGDVFMMEYKLNRSNASDVMSFVSYDHRKPYYFGLYDVVIHPRPFIYNYLLNIWIDKTAKAFSAPIEQKYTTEGIIKTEEVVEARDFWRKRKWGHQTYEAWKKQQSHYKATTDTM